MTFFEKVLRFRDKPTARTSKILMENGRIAVAEFAPYEEEQSDTCSTREVSLFASGFFAESVFVSDEVMEQLISTVGTKEPETGMVLGSSDGGNTVDTCYFDSEGSVSAVTYSPDVNTINNVVLPAWNRDGIRIVGFAHSHPRGCVSPSGGDLAYARDLLKALPQLTKLAMPIVQSKTTGGFSIRFFVARRGLGGDTFIEPCRYSVIHKSNCSNLPGNDEDPRISEVYPQYVMARKTLVVVGCGGSSEYVDHMVRCGVGRVVLFDGDCYEKPNLQTQQVFADELGRNKAVALAERMRKVNPGVEAVGIPRNLDDEVSDELFAEIVGKELLEEHPKDVLIAGCTDNFFGQLRSSRLAMKYGCPYIGAQIYERGAGGEIMFLYPGLTESCPRCMTSSRYKAYLEDGFENGVGSMQSPIFSSQAVNAMKGFVSSMLLLYGEAPESRFDKELDAVADRNFIVMRTDKGLSMPMFDSAFSEIPTTYFGETLWLRQSPDDGEDGRPVCPECGGLGPYGSMTKLEDTRII